MMSLAKKKQTRPDSSHDVSLMLYDVNIMSLFAHVILKLVLALR